MRWETEAEEALKSRGFVNIVDSDGISDYQGWGVILAHGERGFAVLSWYYGSCSGCDRYEDLPHEQVVAELAEDITLYATEEEARAAFVKGKGW